MRYGLETNKKDEKHHKERRKRQKDQQRAESWGSKQRHRRPNGLKSLLREQTPWNENVGGKNMDRIKN